MSPINEIFARIRARYPTESKPELSAIFDRLENNNRMPDAWAMLERRHLEDSGIGYTIKKIIENWFHAEMNHKYLGIRNNTIASFEDLRNSAKKLIDWFDRLPLAQLPQFRPHPARNHPILRGFRVA